MAAVPFNKVGHSATHIHTRQCTAGARLGRVMKKTLLLIASYVVAFAAGFAAGIYALPILTAPPAPSAAEIASQISQATYTG